MSFPALNFQLIQRALAVVAALVTLLAVSPSSAVAQDVMTHEELMRRARGLPPLKAVTNPPPSTVSQPAPPATSPVVRFPAAPKNPPPEASPALVRPPVVTVAAKPVERSASPAPEARPAKAKPSVFSEVPPDFYASAPAASTAAGTAPHSKTNAMAALDDKHQLAIGDRLSFRIVEDEEDPRALLITDSGELEVPYLGRFPAEGKTCKQLAFALKQALEKDYYYQATVVLAVDVLARSRGKVYLVGPVRAPGPQEIPSDEVLTLSKAILRAGGFTDFADKKSVKVTRKTSGDSSADETFTVNVEEILEKGRREADLQLQPGDLIYVQERMIRF